MNRQAFKDSYSEFVLVLGLIYDLWYLKVEPKLYDLKKQ